MASEEELFANIDALLEEEPQLPPPAERARLREAAGITQVRLATALKTSTQSVKNYENGRSEPKSPRLEAYQRLLNGWAAKYPAHGTPAAAPVRRAATGPGNVHRPGCARGARGGDRRAGGGTRRPGRAGATRPPGDVVSPPGREKGSQARDRSTLPARPARGAGR